MDNITIDKTEEVADVNSGQILFIGIGVFLWSSIEAFSYLLDSILKDLFVISGLEPKVNLYFSQALTLFVVVLFMFLTIKRIRDRNIRERKQVIKILRNVVVSFIIILVLQGLYGFASYSFIPASYNDAISEYNTFFNQHSYYNLISIASHFLTYLFVGIIVLRMSKTVKTSV